MDTLIYIVLLVGACIGFYQGAFKQIANLAGVVVGLVLATLLYNQFGDVLAAKTGTSESIGHTIAFVLIAVVTPVVMGWLATLLTALFKKIKLNFINRLVGAVIGAVSYGIVMSIAFNMLDFTDSNAGYKPEKLEERPAVYYAVKQASQIVIPDAIIVTDSTEVANGAEPKYGLKPAVDGAIDKAVDSINPFKKVGDQN
ncbi:MAG: CvpA family protein [Prevotellaceae bacterium]|nr:CvpA family protein [Candidatus Minthosoma caballi]